LVATLIAGATTFALGSTLADAPQAQQLRGATGGMISWFLLDPDHAILLGASFFAVVITVLALAIFIGSSESHDAPPLRIKLVPASSKRSSRKPRSRRTVVQDVRRTRRNVSETLSSAPSHRQMLLSERQWRAQQRGDTCESMDKGSLIRQFSYEDHLRMREIISSQLQHWDTASAPDKYEQMNTMVSTSASGSSRNPSLRQLDDSLTSASGSSHSLLQSCGLKDHSETRASASFEVQLCMAAPVPAGLGIDTMESLPICREMPNFYYASGDDAM